MKKEILDTGEFEEYAEQELVFLQLDFPRRTAQPDNLKRHNEKKLAETFDIKGFPTLVLLSPEGRELARNAGPSRGGFQGLVRWLKPRGSNGLWRRFTIADIDLVFTRAFARSR